MFTLTVLVPPPIHILPADMQALAEADTICENWDSKKMGKRDEKAETALWSSRLFTAPMLLEEPEVLHGTEGHLVSVDVGVGVGLRDDRFVDPLLRWADLDRLICMIGPIARGDG